MNPRAMSTVGLVILQRAALGWFAAFLIMLFVPFAYGQAAAGTQSGPTQAPSSSKNAPAAAPPSSQSSPDTSVQVPTLSENTNEVTLDLVVKDKKQKPILDLKAERRVGKEC